MIYTSIIGGLDKSRDDIKVFKEYAGFTQPVMNAKIYKVLAHLFVPGRSVWVDGNIFPKVDEANIFAEIPYDCDLAMFRHCDRTSAQEEAQYLLDHNTGSPCDVSDWISNNPDGWGSGLFEANVIARRPGAKVRRFNECWWSLICRWPWRDQITLPEALRESGCRIHLFDWSSIANRQHAMFEYRPHGT